MEHLKTRSFNFGLMAIHTDYGVSSPMVQNYEIRISPKNEFVQRNLFYLSNGMIASWSKNGKVWSLTSDFFREKYILLLNGSIPVFNIGTFHISHV